jgi:peptidylprolyl isomerase
MAPAPAVSAPLTFPAPPDVAAPPADARVLPSGVAMKTLHAGTGADRAQGDDCVKVNFTGWWRDGSLQSTSKGHDDAAVQCLRRAMPGLAAALREMAVGESARVWVPGSQTFRAREPDENVPNHDLTFDVEVLAVIHAPVAPADLAKPPAAAIRTPSGLAYVVLTKGSGTEHPAVGGKVRVEFSGWTHDGTVFGTTSTAGRPAVFSMNDVILGWREALPSMVVGEKRRLWVPAALAYGAKPRRGVPAGDLVYELELVGIE